MSRSSSPAPEAVPADERPLAPNWFPAPGEPHDNCFRCGRPTPLGVSLCARDNPGRVKAPSSTQVHGTIALGVIGGFIGFMLLAGALSAGTGPFVAQIAGQATQPDGGLEVVVRVANEGTRLAGASCRISRGGIQGAGDVVFFTEPIPPGETREFSRLVGESDGGRSGESAPGAVAVRCN